MRIIYKKCLSLLLIDTDATTCLRSIQHSVFQELYLLRQHLLLLDIYLLHNS